MALRVALVGGPMYDGLYSLLPADADVVVHADHPTLNRAVAELLAAGERIDVMSTHSKYAPSQARWLTPLDPELARGLAPRAVDLCTYDGALLCVPRNVDVRVMWARHDRLDDPPLTWEALLARRCGLRLHGARVGPLRHVLRTCRVARRCALRLGPAAHARHHARGRGGRRALPHRSIAARPRCRRGTTTTSTPRSVPASSTWPRPGPAASRLSARSRAAPHLSPHPYLSGPAGLRSYSGCHGWAMPLTCGDVPAALDASGSCPRSRRKRSTRESGTVCAHVDAFASVDAAGCDRRRPPRHHPRAPSPTG